MNDQKFVDLIKSLTKDDVNTSRMINLLYPESNDNYVFFFMSTDILLELDSFVKCDDSLCVEVKLSEINPNTHLFVSHRWINSMDPDPQNYQFNEVCEFLKTYSNFKFIFYDYSCMFQKPRTDKQEIMFKSSLSHLDELLKKCSIMITHDETYLERGWCITEFYMGTKTKNGLFLKFNKSNEYIDFMNNITHSEKVASLNMTYKNLLNDDHQSIESSIKYNSEVIRREINDLKFTNNNDVKIVDELLYKGLSVISKKSDYKTCMDKKIGEMWSFWNYSCDYFGFDNDFDMSKSKLDDYVEYEMAKYIHNKSSRSHNNYKEELCSELIEAVGSNDINTVQEWIDKQLNLKLMKTMIKIS